jgi:quinol-cytochrome oxidoreductase complex cytochrome b subunit
MKNQQKKFSRRMIAIFWLAVVGIIITTLIAFEQIAILYVLATLSIVVLLLIVAFADLENVGSDSSGDFSRE